MGDGPELLNDAAEPGEADAAPELRATTVLRAMHGERLDKVVVSMAPEFSRNHLQTLIEAGHVVVDGVAADSASRKVRAGQRVEVRLVETAESRAFRPESIAIDVVYEDEHLMVVDKAAGMVVHPAAGNWSGTLLNAILGRDPAAARLPRAGIVHRLDKDTSGLMVVGRTLPAVTALSQAISTRAVHRQYLAIAHGAVPVEPFSIDAPIGRDPRVRTRMAVVAGAKPSRTDVECVTNALGFSAVRCTLHSGRTHQIRVHMKSRAHPLIADALYGGAPALGMRRQALHATRLEFEHPSSGEALAFQGAPPADFAAAWQQMLDAEADD